MQLLHNMSISSFHCQNDCTALDTVQNILSGTESLITLRHAPSLPQCYCNHCPATSCNTSHFFSPATQKSGSKIRSLSDRRVLQGKWSKKISSVDSTPICIFERWWSTLELLELDQVPTCSLSRLVCLCCLAVRSYWKSVFPSKEYAKMLFAHSSCWAAMVEHWNRHPICRTAHREIFDYVHRTLRDAACFARASTAWRRWCSGSPSTSTRIVIGRPV
jgi:hypothetical protein